jgi:hypothetical protein
MMKAACRRGIGINQPPPMSLSPTSAEKWLGSNPQPPQ